MLTSVVFKPLRCIPSSKASHYFDEIKLKPGENLLSQESAIALQKHPDFARYEEWGAISISNPPIVSEKVEVKTSKQKEVVETAITPSPKNNS